MSNYYEKIWDEFRTRDLAVLSKIGNIETDDEFKAFEEEHKRTIQGFITQLQTKQYNADQDDEECVSRTSLKENDNPNNDDNIKTTPKKAEGRPKRNAFREASALINDQSTQPLNSKMRRPDSASVAIKKEKLSVMSNGSVESVPADLDTEKMPAPVLPVVKKKIKKEPAIKKERTSSKTRTTKTIKPKPEPAVIEKEKHTERESDIIMQKPVIETIDICDSDSSTMEDSEAPTKSPEPPVRSTRTRTRTKKALEAEAVVKPTRSTRTKKKEKEEVVPPPQEERSTRTKSKRERKNATDDESEKQVRKRSKSDPKVQDPNVTGQTEYEDAVDEPLVDTVDTTKNINNATFISEVSTKSSATVLNSTMVIEKPKMVNSDPPQDPMEDLNTGDLLTDDEDTQEDVVEESPPVLPQKELPTKKIVPPKSKVQQLFDPFERSPVKKKVAAFENLGKGEETPPVRSTRTKTKNKEAAKNEDTNTSPQKSLKPSYKVTTPMAERHAPVSGGSTSKINRFVGITKPSYMMNSSKTQSNSLIKASQAEYRARELQRRERDLASKKKEESLQAQAEEKRKLREERQLKAQQQREALEKEQLKKIEAQKLKEERARQLLVEKEECLKKQREELDRKRKDALAKKKAQDEIKREDLPIYMRRRAPYLPTEDCYDSDEPEYATQKLQPPSWCHGKSTQEHIQILAGESIKNKFFCCQETTVDLVNIFGRVDPRKLKRTSSAVWRKPPRFTLMPNYNESILEESD